MKKFIIDVNLHSDSQKRMIADFFRQLAERSDLAIVTGGKKYSLEVKKGPPNLRRLINALKRAGNNKKLYERDSSEVDERAATLEQAVVERCGRCPKECNDFHLLVLCSLSGAKCIFSGDNDIQRCIKKIRPKVGHKQCPNPKFIRQEAEYNKLKSESFVV